MVKKHGLLTNKQLLVLKYRFMNMSFREIASKLNVSHQDIALIYKRALENIEKARETIKIFDILSSKIKIIIEENTRLIDIPRIVFDEADRIGIKVRADFTLLFKLLRFKTRNCIRGNRVVKPIVILINSEGEVNVYPYSEVRDYIRYSFDP
ncbi:MAG: DNA-binding protein [Desulfurococcales archaeon ex4484_58]|nr:MAG: DNA-binding protein [Desulfurococcales archaeon ex4484_58]